MFRYAYRDFFLKVLQYTFLGSGSVIMLRILAGNAAVEGAAALPKDFKILI